MKESTFRGAGYRPRATVFLAAAMMSLVALGACDNGPSAVETRDRAVEPPRERRAPEISAQPLRDEVAAPKTVTANRRETADAKAVRLFERNGAAFGARSAEDYLEKVRVFTTQTPRDVEKVSRPNGDTLLYQTSTNTFAVVARDGTPRTMFKPDSGADYWEQQKASAPNFGRRSNSG